MGVCFALNIKPYVVVHLFYFLYRLYQVLCDEEQAMKQDQIKLKQLRSELLTQRKSQDNFATPIVLTRAKSCNGPFAELSSVIDNETVPVTGIK